MLHLGTRSRGCVVVSDSRVLRCCHYQRVIGVKENEIGAKLGSLCQSEGEGLLVGRNLGGKENGGGFAPTRLDDSSHGNLLLGLRLYFYRFVIELRCSAAQGNVTAGHDCAFTVPVS